MDAMVNRSRLVAGKPVSLLDLGYNHVGLDGGWNYCYPVRCIAHPRALHILFSTCTTSRITQENRSFHWADGTPVWCDWAKGRPCQGNVSFPSPKAMVTKAKRLGLSPGCMLTPTPHTTTTTTHTLLPYTVPHTRIPLPVHSALMIQFKSLSYNLKSFDNLSQKCINTQNEIAIYTHVSLNMYLRHAYTQVVLEQLRMQRAPIPGRDDLHHHGRQRESTCGHGMGGLEARLLLAVQQPQLVERAHQCYRQVPCWRIVTLTLA